MHPDSICTESAGGYRLGNFTGLNHVQLNIVENCRTTSPNTPRQSLKCFALYSAFHLIDMTFAVQRSTTAQMLEKPFRLMPNRLTPRKANSRSHGQNAKTFTDIRDMPNADLQMLKRPACLASSALMGTFFPSISP